MEHLALPQVDVQVDLMLELWMFSKMSKKAAVSLSERTCVLLEGGIIPPQKGTMKAIRGR